MFRRDALDRDFDEELAAHVAMATEDYLRQGVPVDEARRRALGRFGGMTAARQQQRESRGLPSLDAILQDVRYAVRSLRRRPGFTAVVVATVAVAVGLNATVFAMANAVLFKGFPFIPGNDRVVYIQGTDSSGPSFPDFEDWRAQARSFSGLAAYSHGRPVSLSGPGGLPESHYASAVSANAFQVLALQPVLGRDFVPTDEQPGATPVAILGYALWQSRYGGDPGIIGRTIRVNGTPTTVVGVLPKGATFLPGFSLWMPLIPTADMRERRARTLWFAFGRLADGVSLERAQDEIATIGRRLASTYPEDRAFVPTVRDFNAMWTGSKLTRLYGVMWAAAAFALLIACANLAHLLLARGMDRRREISVRLALGAGRSRIVRQLMVECLLLAAAGSLIGWGIAAWGTQAYAHAAYPSPYTSWDFDADGGLAAYLAAIAVATGLLFGLAPALDLARVDILSALKDGGRGTAGARHRARWSRILIACEMALAIVLLAGAGLMTRSFLNISAVETGVDPERVLTGLVMLPAARYPDASSQVAFYDRLEQRLAALPGVESVTTANYLPTQGAARFPYELASAMSVDASRRPILSGLVVNADYFRTLRAIVRAGRAFDDRDRASSPPVAIVNQSFADASWPGEDPIGKRLRLFDGETPGQWRTVVGVARDIVQHSLAQNSGSGWQGDSDPLVYVPFRQQPARGFWLFVRTRLAPAELAIPLRQVLADLDPDLPIDGPRPLTSELSMINEGWGATTTIFLVFATVALALAAFGLFTLVAHAVSQRTQEIGVRMALGATTRDVLALVLGQGLPPVAVGLASGLAAAAIVGPVMRSVLVQVSPADPLTFMAAPAVLLAAALLGCLVPARRAMRVDPLVALRHD